MEAAPRTAEAPLLLVGNPNVGKSALFHHLTGKYVVVSNYPGTTVDVSRGRYRWGEPRTEVVDTPGVYSLQPQSEDEIVTRDLLLSLPDARAVLVMDAKNLQRGLVLAQQLSELGTPFCVALNMMDEALSLGTRIDVEELASELGVPVVPTVATSGRGMGELAAAVADARRGRLACRFPREIETGVARVDGIVAAAVGRPAGRFLATALLVDPRGLPPHALPGLTPEARREIAAVSGDLRRGNPLPLAALLSQARQGAAMELVAAVERPPERPGGGRFAARLGRLCVHPLWGLPIAALCLWLVYELVGVIGAGVLVDWLEGTVFGRFVNPAAAALAERWLPWEPARAFLVGPYGLVTMALTYSFAIILPVVTTFFLAFGVLEDSGYMPRLAVMVNRFFRRMGLHGKAVLPMILGLGCDTMATLTARIMETRKERILVTLLLALGVPCSAQLGVILGMLGGVGVAGAAVWVGVVTLVLVATGALAARLLPGARSDFILELPPLRIPGLKNILVKTGARIEWYLREAVPLFVLGTVLLFGLDRLGLLDAIRAAASPVVGGLLGLPREATDAFLVGFVRRDYGAAGLFEIQRAGLLDGRQVVVSLVIITLYVPCIAQFFVMIKERGLRVAAAISLVVVTVALLVGAGLNRLLLLLGATF